MASANYLDPLAVLLPRYSFQTKVFFTGDFCGSNQFSGTEPVGHLHLVRKGPLAMRHADGSQIEVNEPSLVFYPRPYPHQLLTPLASTGELVCATIEFNEAQHNPISHAFQDCICIPLKEVNELEIVLEMLVGEASTLKIGRGVLLDRMSELVMLYIIRHANQAGVLNPGVLTGLCNPLLAATIQKIITDPGHQWTIEEMTVLSSMTRSKFIQYFQQITGKPPGEFLLQIRMQFAMQLLSENKSVTEVATLIGYSNQPAFSRAFNANVGIAPGAWKSKNF